MQAVVRGLREVVEAVVLALFVFLVLQISVQNFRVEGSSMEPNLHTGEMLFVNKLVYAKLDLNRIARFVPFWDGPADGAPVQLFRAPRRGDVIVFRFPRDPSRDFVKRVIGLPGDTVEVVRGKPYVNGRPLDEEYTFKASMDSMSAIRLLPDQYFVMGDNRPVSDDSRDWGAVPYSHIIGKALVVYWPPSAFELVGWVGAGVLHLAGAVAP